jgi:hypothetical protein
MSGLRALGKRLRRRKRTHEQKDGRQHGEVDAHLHGGRVKPFLTHIALSKCHFAES